MKTIQFAHSVDEHLYMYDDHECNVKMRFMNLDHLEMKKYCDSKGIALKSPNGMFPYFHFSYKVGKVEFTMCSIEMEISATYQPKNQKP